MLFLKSLKLNYLKWKFPRKITIIISERENKFPTKHFVSLFEMKWGKCRKEKGFSPPVFTALFFFFRFNCDQSQFFLRENLTEDQFRKRKHKPSQTAEAPKSLLQNIWLSLKMLNKSHYIENILFIYLYKNLVTK